MTESIWPLGEHTIASPPEHPVLQAISEALLPLRPFLRKLAFHPNDPKPYVVAGLGGEFHLIGIHVLDDHLMIDFPVGDLLQTPENLLSLLDRNAKAQWAFRVDSVVGEPPHVIVVVQKRVPISEVSSLTQILLEGWKHKLVAQSVLYHLSGRGAHL